MTVFPVPESEPLPWGPKIYNFGKGFKNLSSFYSLSAKVEKILTLYHSYIICINPTWPFWLPPIVKTPILGGHEIYNLGWGFKICLNMQSVCIQCQ